MGVNPDERNEKLNDFWREEETNFNSPHPRGKINVFWQPGLWWDICPGTMQSHTSSNIICRDGRAEPASQTFINMLIQTWMTWGFAWYPFAGVWCAHLVGVFNSKHNLYLQTQFPVNFISANPVPIDFPPDSRQNAMEMSGSQSLHPLTYVVLALAGQTTWFWFYVLWVVISSWLCFGQQ